MLVAHPNVQMFVLLFDCSTVSHWSDRQKVASAHSDGSLGGQSRALAHFALFLPFHVTRHLAAWTNSDFGNFETQFDDCNHCPDGRKRLSELARSHLEAPLENCDGSRNQSQAKTEEVMSLVVT